MESEFANSSHTCITCRVVFARGELQREHYKSDWHRYNLKRKVAELPPVTAAVFQSKVLAQRQQEEETNKDLSFRCESCNKTFQSKETYDSHCRSKKHLDALAKWKDGSGSKANAAQAKTPAPEPEPMDEVVVTNEDNDEEWETDEEGDEDEGDGIPPTDCLFCWHSSANAGFQENLSHMSVQHGFFVPDVEYCTDVEGLLDYLGAKVGIGFVCIWCNGRSFHTLDAVQKHMKDKGHCKMLHDGEAMLEYADFYDYSASYPDAGENRQDADMELDEAGIGALEERGWQLVLPSGATIGHRSLMRFYRQRLKPESQVQVVNKRGRLPAVLNQYRALGWTGISGEAAVRKAKDFAIMNKLLAKQRLKVGMLANKFQPHFRKQTNF